MQVDIARIFWIRFVILEVMGPSILQLRSLVNFLSNQIDVGAQQA